MSSASSLFADHGDDQPPVQGKRRRGGETSGEAPPGGFAPLVVPHAASVADTSVSEQHNNVSFDNDGNDSDPDDGHEADEERERGADQSSLDARRYKRIVPKMIEETAMWCGFGVHPVDDSTLHCEQQHQVALAQFCRFTQRRGAEDGTVLRRLALQQAAQVIIDQKARENPHSARWTNLRSAGEFERRRHSQRAINKIDWVGFDLNLRSKEKWREVSESGDAQRVALTIGLSSTFNLFKMSSSALLGQSTKVVRGSLIMLTLQNDSVATGKLVGMWKFCKHDDLYSVSDVTVELLPFRVSEEVDELFGYYTAQPSGQRECCYTSVSKFEKICVQPDYRPRRSNCLFIISDVRTIRATRE